MKTRSRAREPAPRRPAASPWAAGATERARFRPGGRTGNEIARPGGRLAEDSRALQRAALPRYPTRVAGLMRRERGRAGPRRALRSGGRARARTLLRRLAPGALDSGSHALGDGRRAGARGARGDAHLSG